MLDSHAVFLMSDHPQQTLIDADDPLPLYISLTLQIPYIYALCFTTELDQARGECNRGEDSIS